MTYQYVPVSDEQKELMQVYRDKFEILHNEILTNIPNSRWRSSCLTKLEEASFWLNKWITNND